MGTGNSKIELEIIINGLGKYMIKTNNIKNMLKVHINIKGFKNYTTYLSVGLGCLGSIFALAELNKYQNKNLVKLLVSSKNLFDVSLGTLGIGFVFVGLCIKQLKVSKEESKLQRIIILLPIILGPVTAFLFIFSEFKSNILFLYKLCLCLEMILISNFILKQISIIYDWVLGKGKTGADTAKLTLIVTIMIFVMTVIFKAY